MDLILASASPRRKLLLEQLGLKPSVFPVDINEDPTESENAYGYVLRMANEKLAAAMDLIRQEAQDQIEPALVLSSDTSVIVDGQILGKPSDQNDHARMMQLLSGRGHEVVSSFALGKINQAESESVESAYVSTQVWFKPLNEAEIEWYWSTGEPSDKAGGYGIQGIASMFIEKINGSYTNVVGLPLMQVSDALQRHGLQFIR